MRRATRAASPPPRVVTMRAGSSQVAGSGAKGAVSRSSTRCTGSPATGATARSQRPDRAECGSSIRETRDDSRELGRQTRDRFSGAEEPHADAEHLGEIFGQFGRARQAEPLDEARVLPGRFLEFPQRAFAVHPLQPRHEGKARAEDEEGEGQGKAAEESAFARAEGGGGHARILPNMSKTGK
jgi:hypothetical protein